MKGEERGGGGGSVWHPSQKKILSKSPALSGLMLFFSILGGISPFLVPFLESKFKISFLRSISLTLLIFQLDLEQKFGNLLPWILFWCSHFKIFIILSRFALGSTLVGLRFKWVVMFPKWLFMMFAIISSSRTISLFSRSTILFLFRPSLEKNGFLVFNNFLFSELFLTLISLKFFFVWKSNLTQKFLSFL